MPARAADVSIRYVLSVIDRGLRGAITMTKDLDVQTKRTKVGVEGSMKAVSAQWAQLEKIATKADTNIAKTAITTSTEVNKALDKTILKQRELGTSYDAIVKQQKAAGRSATELAASIERSSVKEIAAMKRVREEAAHPIRQHFLPGTPGGGRNVTPLGPVAAADINRTSRLGGFGPVAAGAAAGAGSLALGAGALAVGGAVRGFQVAGQVTPAALSIQRQTGLSARDSLALAVIARSTDTNTRSLGMAFATMSSQLIKMQAGSKPAVAGFQALGISRQQATSLEGNLPALMDLVTQRLSTLHGAPRAALSRQFLGRGATALGPVLAGGPLAGQIADVGAQMKGVSPKELLAMHEAEVKLKTTTAILELQFAKTFGPALIKLMQLAIPVIRALGPIFRDVFHWIGDVLKGPVGQALAKFGQEAFKAGKGLVEAFKPAMPFIKNVLLPLLKGVAQGVAIGIIGAIKLATPIVKVLADILGFLGKVLAPLKTVIEDVGKVLGIVFSGDILATIAKGLGSISAAIPILGDGLKLLLKPFELAGTGISKLFGLFRDLFGRIPGIVTGAIGAVIAFLSGLPGKLLHLAGQAVSGFVSGFTGIGTAVLDAITSAFSAVWAGIKSVGSSIVNAIVDGIKSVPNAIIDAIKGLIPGPLRSALGAVTGAASSVLHFFGLAAGGWVPGDPRRDGTLALLAGDEFVVTGHGQSMMEAHAPGLLDHLAMSQLPHFQGGGRTAHVTRSTRHPRAKKPKSQHVGFGASFDRVYPQHGDSNASGHFVFTAAQVRQIAQAGGFGGDSTHMVEIARGESSYYPGDVSVDDGWGLWQLTPRTWGGAGRPYQLMQQLGGKTQMLNPLKNVVVSKALYDDAAKTGNRFVPWHGTKYLSGVGSAPATTSPSYSAVRSAVGAVGTIPSNVTSTHAAAARAAGPPTVSAASLTPRGAFGAGYTAGLAGDTLSGTLGGVLGSAIGDVAVTSSGLIGGLTTPTHAAAAAASTTAMAPKGRYAKMVAKASEIASKRYYYEYAGGHNATFSPTHWSGGNHGSGPGIGYCCSGSVSAVLHAGGLLSAPQVSGQLMSFGQSGPGRQVSIYASPTHTFMKLGQRYFGTSGQNFGGGANWIPSFPGNIGATRHPPGMRRGGFLRSYRRGGGIEQASKSFASSTAGGGAHGGGLAALMKLVDALLAQPIAANVAPLVTKLATGLDDVGKLSTERLTSFIDVLSHRTATGDIPKRRLQTAINLAQAALGNRIGLMVKAFDDVATVLTASKTAMDNAQQRAGIDSASSQALKASSEYSQGMMGFFGSQVTMLQGALTVARRFGDKATITDLQTRLTAAIANWDQAFTTMVVDARSALEAAAQEALAASTHGTTMASTGQTTLSLQQQIAGTAGTPQGAQQMAAYITSTVIPALKGELGALANQLATAQSVGDTALATQIAEAIAAKQNDILQASLDAQTAIKDATQATASALHDYSGTTGFQFQSQDFTDLIGAGTGQ